MTSESTQPERPQPQIEDRFWFDRSRAMVEASITAYHDAAGKLQGLIGWLWAVYAVTTGAKLTLSGPPSIRDSTGFILAAVTLIAAYALAVKAQMPTSVTFDPRDPDEIRDVYFAAVKRKAQWLTATIITASIALITLTGALITTASRPAAVTPTLSVSDINGTIYLIVEATEPCNAVLQVHAKGKVTIEKVLVMRGVHPHASIAIPSAPMPRQAVLTWQTEDDTSMTLTRQIPSTAN